MLALKPLIAKMLARLVQFTTGYGGTATLNTTYVTGGAIHYKKYGGVVTVKFQALVVKQLTARTVIATIPEGFRPYTEVYGTVNNNTRYALVSQNGDVSLEPGSAGTIYVSMTYVIA